MSIPSLGKEKKNLTPNMGSFRQYGTFGLGADSNFHISKNYSDQTQNMLKVVPLLNYRLFDTATLITDKKFKTYENTENTKKRSEPIADVTVIGVDNSKDTMLRAFTGVIGAFVKTPKAQQDEVDGSILLNNHIQSDLHEQMESSKNMMGSQNNIKMYHMLDQCQSTSGQSNTADINGKTLGEYFQSICNACNDTSYLSPKSLFPTDCEVNGENSAVNGLTYENCGNKSNQSSMLCSQVNKCDMDSTPRWHSTSSTTTFDNPKLTQIQLKYQSSQSDNRSIERKSNVSSKFLQQVRERKAEASQNELRNKKQLDTASSVSSCEDKIARLKELLSRKQRSYNVDELKQVPRGARSKESSPCLKSDENESTLTVQDISEPDPESGCLVCDPVLPSVCVPTCVITPAPLIETDPTIEELEKLMNKLSLADEDSSCELSTAIVMGDTHMNETMPTDNTQLDSMETKVNEDIIDLPTVPKPIELESNNKCKQIDLPECIVNVCVDVKCGEALPEHIQGSHSDSKTTADDSSIHIKTEKHIEDPLKMERVTDVNKNVCTDSQDLSPNTNHNKATPVAVNDRKNKKSRIQKNHRLTATKVDENTMQIGEGSGLQGEAVEKRLSPPKERHDKVCSKRHKNEHCMKKHRHKEKQSFKMDIKDDLTYDSSSDVSQPIYFSPENLQLEKAVIKSNKKPKPRKKSENSSDESPTKCKISESVEKCVNFISNLPSQISPLVNNMCSSSYKNRLSSTESEDCLGFDEIKGKFKHNNSSECESDDSFVIVFSDDKKDEASEKKTCRKERRARVPSECDSEDSFIICFEGDEDASPDQCYGNDEVYSDSDSYSSDSDTEESSGEETDSEVSSDECETIREQSPRLRSCLKRRTSPKPEPVPAKKVSFNAQPEVHKMIVWSFAYRQARIGPWERYGRDAERFKQRIRDTSVCLEWVFKREHRNRIFFQRFRPILMRAIREEKEAKAREVKRLKEEESKRLEEEKRLQEEEEKRLLEQEAQKKIEMEQNQQAMDSDRQEKETVATIESVSVKGNIEMTNESHTSPVTTNCSEGPSIQ